MASEPRWRPFKKQLFRPSYVATCLFLTFSIVSFIVFVDLALKYNKCRHSKHGNSDECDGLQVWKYIFLGAWIVFAALFGIQVHTNLKGKSFSDADMERGYYEDEEEYLRGEQ
jgi:hypothetical protein